ncbi:MAG TPA: hypothetical protein VMQ54_03280 [Steroidobacteraceae bacterium]|jgi:hypothetical protein|nr:hypothetical protein [Steroidobacteraceae bacterium]
MHASLAYLNGAGAQDPAGGGDDACFELLNLLCTTHQVVGVKVQAVASLSAAAARKADTKCRSRLVSVSNRDERVLPDI